MTLNGSAEVQRPYAAHLRDAQALIRPPLFMHAAYNGQDGTQWPSVRRLARASPKTGGCQPVVAGGVTKAWREARRCRWPHLLVATMLCVIQSNTGDGLRFYLLNSARSRESDGSWLGSPSKLPRFGIRNRRCVFSRCGVWMRRWQCVRPSFSSSMSKRPRSGAGGESGKTGLRRQH
jgi:hypothetical protein